MNETIVNLPNGDFTTEQYLEKNSILTVIVHTFSVGDAEDPDLYAGAPLIDWQNSEQGKWIMEHAVETPSWHRSIDQSFMGYQYKIIAKLNPKDFTYWSLKWQKLS